MNHRNEHRAWLNPRNATNEMRTRIEHAINNATNTTPTDPRLAGDPFLLRGVPVVGVPGGLGGHSPGTRPDLAIVR